jgi:hypothetical protein
MAGPRVDAFNKLSAEDLGAIVAYVKSAPPVDHEVPETKGGPLGRIFVARGMFDAGPAIRRYLVSLAGPAGR